MPRDRRKKKIASRYGLIEISKNHNWSTTASGFHISPYLLELQLYSGQADNFYLAAERLNNFLRIETSSSQIDRVTKYYGSVLEVDFDKIKNTDYELFISDKMDIPEADQSYVMMDGSMILTRENSDWKEMKLGRIFNCKDGGELSLSRN